MAETIAQAIKRDTNFLKKEVQKAVKEREQKDKLKKSSSKSSGGLVGTIRDVKTGEIVGYMQGNTPVKYEGVKSGSFVGGNIEINATDLKTGISTQKVIDTRTGRTLSNRTMSSPAMTFQSSGLSFLSKSLTPQQQNQVLNKLNEETIRKINTINMSRKLNPLQKENLKRQVLGIGQKSPLTTRIEQEKMLKRITNIDYKKLGDQEIKLVNKFNTRQSVTPQEKVEYLAIVRAQGNNLEKQQAQLFKNIVGSPVNYGKNLVLRYERGESNPLFNDLKSFSKGFVKGTAEIVIFPVKTLAGAYNYGTNLVKQAEKQGTRTINILARDVRKVAKGVKNTAKFVKSNPVESALIVATAVSLGATALGKEFSKNPANALGQAVAFLYAPGLIVKGVKGVGKGSKLLLNIVNKEIKTINNILKNKKISALNAKKLKNSVNNIKKIKVKAEILKGAEKELIDKRFNKFEEILKNKKVETLLLEQKPLELSYIKKAKKIKNSNELKNYILKLDEEKLLNVLQNSAPKRIKEINKILSQEKGFKYVTKKLEKPILDFDRKRKITKEFIKQTTKFKKGDVKVIFSRRGLAGLTEKQVAEKLSKYIDKKTGRVPNDIRSAVKKAGFEIKTQNNLIQVNKLPAKFKGKKIFIRETQDLNKLKSKRLENNNKIWDDIVKNIERKESKEVVKKRLNDRFGKKGQVSISRSKAKQVKSSVRKVVSRNKSKSSNIKAKTNNIIKKGRERFKTISNKLKTFRNERNIVKNAPKSNSAKKIRGRRGIRRKEINRIKQNFKKDIKLSKKNYNIVKSEIDKLKAFLNTVTTINAITNKIDLKQEIKVGNDTLQDLQNIQKIAFEQIQEQSNILKQLENFEDFYRNYENPRKPNDNTNKPITKPKIIIKPPILIKKPKPIKEEPPTLPKIPRFDLSFKKLKPNQIAEFKAVYRERRNPNKNFNPKSNPIVIKSLKIQSTKNRMLQRVAKLVDNNAARSIDVKVVKLTNKKKKDISRPKVLKKFKSSKGKALKLVEKPKFTIDTKGEKKQLKTLKQIKPKKKKSVKRKRR